MNWRRPAALLISLKLFFVTVVVGIVEAVLKYTGCCPLVSRKVSKYIVQCLANNPTISPWNHHQMAQKMRGFPCDPWPTLATCANISICLVPNFPSIIHLHAFKNFRPGTLIWSHSLTLWLWNALEAHRATFFQWKSHTSCSNVCRNSRNSNGPCGSIRSACSMHIFPLSWRHCVFRRWL